MARGDGEAQEPRTTAPPRVTPRMSFRPPVLLEGRYVRLEPLDPVHLPGLVEAGRAEAIWTYMRTGDHRGPERMRELLLALLAAQEAGTDLPFTVRLRATGEVVGMTRYLNIARADEHVEIGGTWYALPYQRTPVNTEAKLLLLTHAFETEGCHRVEIKTDVLNVRSQRAIERVGFKREGVLREHFRLTDRYRTSVVYALLLEEWPAVRARLEALRERPWSGPRAGPST